MLSVAARIHADRPRSDFEGRYGFRRKPERVRFRFLDDSHLAGFTELTVRTAEFTTRPTAVAPVYVIENEISYLAFSPVLGGMAVCGTTSGRSKARRTSTGPLFRGTGDLSSTMADGAVSPGLVCTPVRREGERHERVQRESGRRGDVQAATGE